MHVILLMARLLLAMTFAVAGAAKLADPVGSRQSILEFGAPAFLARPLSWLLPLVELGCAIALVPLASAWWGAGGVLVLLLLFIAVISISLARGRRPDCHCFGQLHSSPVGWKTLARNVVLAGMAAFVVWQGPENQGASVVSLLSVFQSAAPVFVIVIAGLAAFQIWALFHWLRQDGRLRLAL